MAELKDNIPGILCLIVFPFIVYHTGGQNYVITWYIALFAGLWLSNWWK